MDHSADEVAPQTGQGLAADEWIASVRALAHELSNMVAVILGRAQLLYMQDEKEELVAGLNIIESAAMDAAEMVKNLRKFTASGQMEKPLAGCRNGCPSGNLVNTMPSIRKLLLTVR